MVERHGVRAPGRDIVKWGVAVSPDVSRRAYTHEIRKSIDVLTRMLTPVVVKPTPIATAALPVPVARAAVSTYREGGSGAMPYCTWGPESGGNYRARNPSGAGGKYQIMPGTWKAYGGGGGNAADASPAEQESVARRIHSAEGTRPWVNCH